jgi:outer membrane protein assembly factor BamB
MSNSSAFDAILEFTQPSNGVVFNMPGEPVVSAGCGFGVWIKTTVATQQVIFQWISSELCIYLENNQIGLMWNGGPWLSAATTPISDGNWHHIAVVLTQMDLTFFIDGNPSGATVTLPAKGAFGKINLGGGSTTGISSFIGQMWNAAVWNGPTTTENISALMYQFFAADEVVPSNYSLFSSFDMAANTATNRSSILESDPTTVITGAELIWAAVPPNGGFAFEFTGVDPDGVSLGTIPDISSKAATFECWIKMSTAPGVSAKPQTILLINQPNDISGIAIPRIDYDGNDQLGCFWSVEIGTCSDTRPISDGAWHHIAVVFNCNVLTFYKDGLPAAETLSMSPTRWSGDTFVIGGGIDWTTSFNGQIRDARLWNVARSVSDIQGSMYATLTGSEPGLVALNNLAYWDPGNSSSQPVVNQVGNVPGAMLGAAKVINTGCGSLLQQPVPQNVWMYDTAGIAPLGPQLSPTGLIYAENVAASGSTPAGNYLHSLDLQTHTVNWTYSVHDNSGLNTPVIPASVGVGFANVYVGAQDPATSGINSVVEIHAVDSGTGQAVWAAPAQLNATTILTRPVEAAGMVLVCASLGFSNDPYDYLFTIDVATGTQVNSYPMPNLTSFVSEPIVQTHGTPGNLTTTAYMAASSDSTHNWIVVVDLPGGTPTMANLPAVPSGGVAVDQNNFYVACDDGTIIAYNVASGNIVWTQNNSNVPINSQPVVIGTTLFVGSSDGNLYSYDTDSGAPLWQLDTGAPIVTDLVTADGAIYFANQAGNSCPTFYSVGASGMGNDVVTYNLPTPDTILFGRAQANGVVYFYGAQTIYALNMSMLLHEFNVDTKLIVEDYDTSTSTPAGSDTSYRITIALNDSLKMPRVNQSVKIWAADTLYLSNMLDASGSPTMIGPDNPLWVQTDGSGQVSLAVSAYDDGSVGGSGATATPLVSCPAIFAWANFMMPGEAITIYPDHESLGNLSTVQGQAPAAAAAAATGTSTLYLSQATGYDGTPLIQSTYLNNNDAMTAIASTVINTIGTRNTASVSSTATSAPTGSSSSSNKYIAYPASMPNVNYVSDNTAPTTRPFAPGSDTVFTMDLSGSTPSYQPGVYDQNPPPASSPNASFNPFHSIDDLVNNVIKGAERVEKLAWQFAANAVSTIIHTAESVYTLTITTLEDAVKAAIAFLKSVVTDLKKAIEWLSALFDLQAIFTNVQLIQSLITTADNTGMLDKIQVWIQNEITNFGNAEQSCISAMFGSITGQGASSINTASSNPALAGQTVGATQSSNGTVNDAYNTGGANNATQCKFMHQKTMEGNGSTVTAQQRSNLARQSASAVRASQSLTSGPDPSELTAAFEKFFTSVGGAVAAQGEEFQTQYQQAQSAFASKFKDPKSFIGNAVTDVLAILVTIADDLIEIGAAIALDFLQFLNTLFGQLVTWLKSPAPSIPVISRLYQSLAGTPMTNMDIMIFIAAVPTTILMEVITGVKTPPAGSVPGTPPLPTSAVAAAAILPADKIGKIFLGILNFAVGAITAVIDGYMFMWSSLVADSNADMENAFGNLICVVADTLSWIVGMCVNFGWNSWEKQDWGYWGGVLGFPLVWEFIQWALQVAGLSLPTDTTVIVDAAYGTALSIIDIVYAILWPSNYMNAPEADGLVIAGNVIGSLSYRAELLYFLNRVLGDGTGSSLAGAAKILLEEVSAVVGFAGYVVTVARSPTSSEGVSAVPNASAFPSYS